MTIHRFTAALALVVAAAGDAGPEIAASHSLAAHYDGPGPLIDLAVAGIVAGGRWRYPPLLATLAGVLFLTGGFLSSDFVSRLGAHSDTVPFYGAWLQIAGFATAAVAGVVAVRPKGAPS